MDKLSGVTENRSWGKGAMSGGANMPKAGRRRELPWSVWMIARLCFITCN